MLTNSVNVTIPQSPVQPINAGRLWSSIDQNFSELFDHQAGIIQRQMGQLAATERAAKLKHCLHVKSQCVFYQILQDTLYCTQVDPIFDTNSSNWKVNLMEFPSRFLADGCEILKTGWSNYLIEMSDFTQAVFHHLINGKSNEEIGKLLFRSTRTIEGHASKILSVLGLSSRAAAIIWGVSRGLDSIPFEMWQKIKLEKGKTI